MSSRLLSTISARAFGAALAGMPDFVTSVSAASIILRNRSPRRSGRMVLICSCKDNADGLLIFDALGFDTPVEGTQEIRVPANIAGSAADPSVGGAPVTSGDDNNV